MPPQKAQVSCPRCRKPTTAVVEQLFDVTADPGAKQRLLSGISNVVACQVCGFSGPLATPIVYHDAEKEILITYFPSELNIPLNEQEKLIGPMILQVTNRLFPEKRKAYLLRPQSFFTYQSFLERILSGDGITPEMLKAQQNRINVIDQLLNATSPELQTPIIEKEKQLFDADFFMLFGRVLDSALASGQEQLVSEMNALQQILFTQTEYGRRISAQYQETQEAVKILQSAGKGLTRTKLLDIIVESPNEDRLNALVSMTRPGLDYQFFQELSERIEKQTGEQKASLEELRTKLLDLTQKIDQRIEVDTKNANQLLADLLGSDEIEKATAVRLQEIDDLFIQVLNQALQEANQKNDTERMPKLQKIVAVLQKASAPPPELELLEQLLQADDDQGLEKIINENSKSINADFLSLVTNFITKTETSEANQVSSEGSDLLKKLQRVYRGLLKFTMNSNR